MRHYVRLTQKNYAIDTGMYPLGSCTMKHNPRLNEKMARLPGFADIHPLQPLSTVPGALELIAELARWLLDTDRHGGRRHVAQGRRAWRALRHDGDQGGARGQARGEQPQDRAGAGLAHGTNPATAARSASRCGRCRRAPTAPSIREAVKAALGPDVAAIMLTNPTPAGCSSARSSRSPRRCTRPAPISTATAPTSTPSSARCGPAISASTPCTSTCTRPSRRRTAAAGPGAGPVVLSRALAPFAPVPFIVAGSDGGLRLVEQRRRGATPFGRMTAFHGQMGMFVRALAYMLSHGADGMRQAAEDAVLNANYVRAALADLMSLPFGDRPCMHEALFDDAWLKGTGVTTLDFAKAMIDEGFHPMTMYFPLVVHGAMLIEPTESESKASLDLFIATLRDSRCAARARRGRALSRRAALCAAPPPRRDAGGAKADAALAQAGADRPEPGGGITVSRGCHSRRLRRRLFATPMAAAAIQRNSGNPGISIAASLFRAPRNTGL